MRDIEPGSAIDCPPCDPDDPRQRSHSLTSVKHLPSVKGSLIEILYLSANLRWQLDGHGGEEGTLVVEAFPKLCLVAGDQMIEVKSFTQNLDRLKCIVLQMFHG